jgi:hypothetical protein
LAVLVALILGLTMAWAGAAAAATRPVVRIKINHTSIRVGSSATISGSVSPNLHGRTVYLQKRTSSGWRDVAHKRLSAKSRYAFTVTAKRTGTTTYRVVKPKVRGGGARAVSSSVSLRVRARAAANCTPGYSPCIPPGSDVDCAGGSGNGPRYVDGPIYVTGSDPYDLDRVGDGVACE